MAKTKIHGEYLDPSVISGQTQVTAVGADSMLIFDATDNALKKALLSDLIETVGSTPTFSQISATSDLTLDVGGDIILDAAGDNWLFKKSGTTLLNIQKDFLNENDKFIVEDILIHTLLESKKLESIETFHYQINVSYEIEEN